MNVCYRYCMRGLGKEIWGNKIVKTFLQIGICFVVKKNFMFLFVKAPFDCHLLIE